MVRKSIVKDINKNENDELNMVTKRDFKSLNANFENPKYQGSFSLPFILKCQIHI